MVPFNGTVSGYINALPSDVVNFGNANQLGAFTGTAEFYPNPPDPVTGCFTYTGFFHWLAANGDKLEGSFEGYSCPTDTPGVFESRNFGRGPGSQHRSLCSTVILSWAGESTSQQSHPPLSFRGKGLSQASGRKGTRDRTPDLRITTPVRNLGGANDLDCRRAWRQKAFHRARR